MALRISVDDKTIDRILVWAMYLQLVILEFFGLGNILNKVISIVILLRILSRYGRFAIRQKAFYLAMGIFVLYLLGGLLSSGDMSIFYSNLLNMLYPMIYAFYIFTLFECQRKLMDRFIENGAWVFNLTMIVNLYVLYRQIVEPYSISAVLVGQEIDFYEDLISGLFQYASTHVVCLFASFIVIYNMMKGRQITSTAQKVLMYVFIVIIIIASASIALVSDNKALFLFMPIVIIEYYLVANGDSGLSRNIKVVLGLCFTLVIITVLYSISPYVQEFVDDNILNMFNMISSAYSLGNSANGSNERVAMIGYALSEGSTWFLGKGFGSVGMFTSGYLGFNHFGQNDLSFMLILGGIWYTILMLWFYINMFIRIIDGETRLVGFQKIGIEFLFLCVAIYTQCMARSSMMVCMMLLISAYRLANRRIINMDAGNGQDEGLILNRKMK